MRSLWAISAVSAPVPSSISWRGNIDGFDWARLCRIAGVQQGHIKVSSGIMATVQTQLSRIVDGHRSRESNLRFNLMKLMPRRKGEIEAVD